MIGTTNKHMTLGGLVIALALSAMAATPAHAGLTNIPSPAKTESKTDWSDQTIRFNIDSTSSSSIDTQSLFASQTSETTSTANIEMIPTTAHTAAEAPMPPAVISGAVLMILGAIAARVMTRKLAM